MPDIIVNNSDFRIKKPVVDVPNITVNMYNSYKYQKIKTSRKTHSQYYSSTVVIIKEITEKYHINDKNLQITKGIIYIKRTDIY